MSTRPQMPGSFPTSSREIPTTDASSEVNFPGKRSSWKTGKNTEEENLKNKGKMAAAPRPAAPHVAAAGVLRPVSPMRSPEPTRSSASPHRHHPYGSASLPSGQGMYSSSPRLHSPASSQIFERNVQEDVLPPQASPQIPSHIITENHIPPALDASTDAITNERLDPDSVEIVTHSLHQPASANFPGAGAEQSMASSLYDDFGHGLQFEHNEDAASTYGTLDSNDVRRLSFISFADVVHAETGGEGHHRDSFQLSAHPMQAPPRSPSPVLSPTSSHGLGTSPRTSVSASYKGTSPDRGGTRGAGSPMPQSPPLGGELSIQTMRQALRKTGSGDLGGVRSQPLSAVGNDDGSFADRPFR